VSLEERYLKIISGDDRRLSAMLFRGVLYLAHWPYCGMTRLRNLAYDHHALGVHHLSRPTISVGNLTAGGTGKTPVVHWLAETLRSQGYRPSILLRGHRKANALISDEATMLQTQLPDVPVIADPDRIRGANQALKQRPDIDCFILDDGFQHRRAGRDFDLVLVNAREPFGFGYVHPRGLLRESLHGLRRASAILITHRSEVEPERFATIEKRIGQYTSAPIYHCDHVNEELISQDGLRCLPLDELRQQPFLLVTAIGHPQSLVNRLSEFASQRGELIYPDHHDYSRGDLEMITAQCEKSQAKLIVTTEKDWAKLSLIWHERMPPVYRLRLRLRFDEGERERLVDKLLSVVGEQKKPPQNAAADSG